MSLGRAWVHDLPNKLTQASEAGFRVQDLMVFQIQIAKRVDAVPITRDYIADWKVAHPLDRALPARKTGSCD